MLYDMHLKKIDLVDEIFVINKWKYVGESMRREIEYAANRKKIIFMYIINVTD